MILAQLSTSYYSYFLIVCVIVKCKSQKMRKSLFLIVVCLLTGIVSMAQPFRNPGSNHGNRFEQLDYLMQDPNEYRTASGAPGPKYWQQRADYDINVEINEVDNILTGSETVTYFNNSPDILTYIWWR